MVSKKLIVAASLLMSPAAYAQDLTSAAERTAACLSVDDDAARLACFEEGTAALSAALGAASEGPTDMVASSDSGSQSALPGWADAPEPDPAPAESVASAEADKDNTPIWARLIPRPDPDTTADSINLTVTRILRNNRGRHYFIMENGQEWEQTIPENVKPPKRLPVGVTITESLTGNPGLTFDDGTTGLYKVRRVK